MFDFERIQKIKEWKTNDSIPICIGCDVGISVLKVRLSDFNNPSRFIDIGHEKANTTYKIIQVLQDLQEKLLQVDSQVIRLGSANSFAGPIKNNTVTITNWNGSIEDRSLSISQLPSSIFPKERSVFLNDLEACAYGIIAAKEQGILEENFAQLFEDKAPEGPVLSNERTAILAMGSGFGVALIARTPLHDKPVVVPTELRHIQIPPRMEKHKMFAEEDDLLEYISKCNYQGRLDPEYEDICSARGIKICYQYYHLKSTGEKINLDKIDPADIAQRAIRGERDAHDALKTHYLYYFRAAKTIASSLSCQSIVLALANQVKNYPFVMSIVEELEDEFYEFIRPDCICGTRIYSQTSLLNFNILGTIYMAHAIANMAE